MEIAGKEYRTRRLTPRQQLHVTRRMAPVIGKVVKVALGLPEEALNKLSDGEALSAVAAPIMEALAAMAEKDVDYVLDTCLAVCDRKEADQWAPVMHPETKRMMYEDIEMPDMLRLCAAVIQGNLGRFLPGQLRA